MLLTINALNGTVTLQDPFPAEGQRFAISLAAGATKTFSVSAALFARILPALSHFEAKKTAAGLPWASFSVADDTAEDNRIAQPGLTGLPQLSWADATNVSVGTPADLDLVGTNLLSGQTKAEAVLGESGAGQVKYVAVVPGAGGNLVSVTHVVSGALTALSVAVDGNDITVNLETDAGGLPISTAAEVVAAVTGDAVANLLAHASEETAGVCAAVAATTLEGGKGAGLSVTCGGIACTVKVTADTLLTVGVPLLAGIAASKVAVVAVRSGGQLTTLSLPTAA